LPTYFTTALKRVGWKTGKGTRKIRGGLTVDLFYVLGRNFMAESWGGLRSLAFREEPKTIAILGGNGEELVVSRAEEKSG